MEFCSVENPAHFVLPLLCFIQFGIEFAAEHLLPLLSPLLTAQQLNVQQFAKYMLFFKDILRYCYHILTTSLSCFSFSLSALSFLPLSGLIVGGSRKNEELR